MSSFEVPLSQLEAEEKSRRGGSFGGVASHYERYRPGPSPRAVEWLVPERVRRVVDLGAGTGAATRLLLDRADEVVAVEPDARMREVLGEQVPGARAVDGRGESIPLPDGSVDAVVASSSWHWMDPLPTLAEVARVLVPGGTLGAVWSGPDPEGAFLLQAQEMLAGGASDSGGLGDVVLRDGAAADVAPEIPDGMGYSGPEHEVFTWDVALTADDLVGLLGTMSWVITMDDAAREQLFAEARRLLREILGVEGDVTVDVAFRADAYRARRTLARGGS